MHARERARGMHRDVHAEVGAATLIASRNGPFVICADDSDVGVGAVLLQRQEGALQPLEFASRSSPPWATV